MKKYLLITATLNLNAQDSVQAPSLNTQDVAQALRLDAQDSVQVLKFKD